MPDMSGTKRTLLKSFIGSNIVALGAGTPYIYSYYAPKLLERCNIPISKSSSISFSLNIGSSLLAMFAGMIIDYNPAISCLVGGVTTFIAYGILHICHANALSNVYLISFALVLVGFGSISGFFAGVKVCTANFPRNRGTATAFPISLYALSGMVFSMICAKLFGDDMLGVFRFLQIACTIMILVGTFTLKIVTVSFEDEEPKDTENGDTENDNYNFNTIYQGGGQLESSTSVDQISDNERVIANYSNKHTRSKSDMIHTNTHPSAERSYDIFEDPVTAITTFTSNQEGSNNSIVSQRNSFSTESREHDIHNEANNITALRRDTISEGDEEETSFERYFASNILLKLQNNKVIQTIIDPKYLVFYAILAIQMGIGQMYIYSVGFLIQVQVNTPPISDYHLDMAKLQAFQISMFAIFSFCGRLTSGPTSDILVRKFKCQRLWNIFFASFLVLVASHFITYSYNVDEYESRKTDSIPSIKNISICTTIFGYAFGMIFGTFPSIIADTFGTDSFSTIWSICTTGGVFTVKFFTSILAHDLSSNSKENENLCKIGTSCYKHTFNTIFDICLVGITLTAMMIFGSYWENQKRLSNESADINETIQLQSDQ
ncbi:similar to Saccharomyces cerevisiae YMR155W Putative protein of unknown function [Maudiozyma saulgeensis]|uniref:Uncharacterized protein n=1 Tax=Maudiozyma saulgeensis TaxID=1789683 RepID=A0A1X7R127_9SACH|nr:similar to Saccharomyces cerevisiae YMR155W Putative protein of unknown function [Kazachstania saulgeensis]